ncbi:hypothetical protein ACPYPG_07005 [Streptomyces sp. FR-108]|uniref:hypothetical protein n=1 Tax=Streptomyces sp. FR-108 TaxID=3416665 RepID=UPI003CF02E9E
MAWRYECDDCDHRTTWTGRADAETARFQHHDDGHNGGAPARERFTSNNAERVASNPRQLLFVGVLFGLAFLYWVWDTIT